ncbi:MAG: transcriptional repressor NrdR [Sphingomonadales bacterium]|nr:transcriptional repressor NrdR [Sphingomonadales bacterium]
MPARFTTFERIQLRDIIVVKSGGASEPFNRDKLAHSVELACRKRAIDPVRIERLVSGIQRQLETSGETEVNSAKIGELAMEGLKGLDSVAYIRFASVYKDFTEAKDFQEFAGSIREVSGE